MREPQHVVFCGVVPGPLWNVAGSLDRQSVLASRTRLPFIAISDKVRYDTGARPIRAGSLYKPLGRVQNCVLARVANKHRVE